MVLGFPVLAFVADKIPLINQYQIFGNTVYAFAVAGFLLASYGIFLSKQVSIRSVAFLLGGYAYLTVSIASLVYLASLPYHNSVNASWLPNGVVLPLFVIACMWINDTLAYIVGSLVGKTPLSKISPKKTWEGTIGGIILCGLVVGYGMHVFSSGALPISVYGWIILAALNGVTGTLGDLLESKFKRLANVKDSGTFMPGHGGFLDRFDSLLLAAPIFLFIYLRFT
jgi:phosphatidate cytidylyltransferase